MAEPAFLELHRRLIQGGIPPRRVERLLKELRDHHANLVTEYQGMGSDQPAADALARLGTEEILAQQYLARPELQSWSRRWPWAVYGVVPLVSFAAAFVATILLMIGLVGLMYEPGHTMPPHLFAAVRTMRVFGLYGVPTMVAGSFALLGRRRGVSRVWIGLAVGGVTLLGALFNLDVSDHRIGAGIGVSTRGEFFVNVIGFRWLPTIIGALVLFSMVQYVGRRRHGLLN